jgi:uncharacterized protein YbcI
MSIVGQMEAELCQAVIRFQKDYLGRGAEETRAYLLADLVVIRCRHVLHPHERRLLNEGGVKRGSEVVKQMRRAVMAQQRHHLEAAVQAVLDSSLWEHTSAGWQNLSPAGTILAVSSVTDGAGQDVAFAIPADHNLWEHSPAIPGGWMRLSTGSFQSVSAAINPSGYEVAFGVLADNSLWEYSSYFPASTGYWEELSSSGSILSVSAVSDAGNNEVVFAVTSNHELWEHSSWLARAARRPTGCWRTARCGSTTWPSPRLPATGRCCWDRAPP